MLWLKKERPKIVASLGADGNKVAEVAKIAGAKWNKLTAKAKKPFEDEAKKLKAKYLAEKEAFEKAGGVMPVPKSRSEKTKRANKDPNLPKRPLSSYMLWLADTRQSIADSLPEGSKVTQVMVEAGKKWKKLTKKAKGPYEKKAAELKEAYQAEMAALTG